MELDLLTVGLAVYALLVVLRAWREKRPLLLPSMAAVFGASLGMLLAGWPQGLVFGLAGGAIAPLALKRWGVEKTTGEIEENGPPKALEDLDEGEGR